MNTASPYLAYFDHSFICETCQEVFVFSKEEQRHWYEELSFIVYAKPKSCQACRKKLRNDKTLNTELSNLLAGGIPQEKDKLLRLAEIYASMGKEEKVRRYTNAARRLK